MRAVREVILPVPFSILPVMVVVACISGGGTDLGNSCTVGVPVSLGGLLVMTTWS